MIQLVKKDNAIEVVKDPPGYKGCDYSVIMQALDDKEVGFAKKVATFLTEFPKLGDACKLALPALIADAQGKSKSWRNFNTNLRRVANQFTHSSGIMNNADFQARWFYEGSMEGRTTYGKDAPWATYGPVTKQSVVKNTEVKAKAGFVADPADRVEQPVKKGKKNETWNEEIDWERKNAAIDKAIYG